MRNSEQQRRKNTIAAGGRPWWGPLSHALDLAITYVKWPIAVLALVALPLSIVASLRLLGRIWSDPTPVMAFAVGLVAYLVGWQLIFRRRLFGTFFSTLEHELTHALFAVITFHPVRELRSTFTQGGHVKYLLYRSRGNWLITVSPYFFPTLSYLLILCLAFVPANYRWWAESLLVAVTAYHITSTMHETHRGQTDLQQAGYLFSLLFLPAANIIALGAILAFTHGGLTGVWELVVDIVSPLVRLLRGYSTVS